MNNPAVVLKNDTHKLPWDFDIHTDHVISVRRLDLIIIIINNNNNNNNNNKKRTCKIVDCAVPADYRIKLKECEKKDKYFDLARELKKNYGAWKWQLYIVIGSFCTVTNGLLKGQEDVEVGGWVDTIQTTVL